MSIVSVVRKTSPMGSSNFANEHIVMLPFMAQGHLIPFLALAQKIQHKFDFSITIASTPLNIKYLRTQLRNRKSETETKSEIHLAELPFPNTDHGLPPNIENTENLRLDEIGKFSHATTSLQTPFHGLIKKITSDEGRPPICIISDVFCGWASEVAESCGTSNVTFSTCGAYGTAAYVSFWQNLPHRDTDSDEFNIPGFPTTALFHRSMVHKYLLAADGTDEWSLFFQRQISLSLKSRGGWLCNTVEEIEPVGLDILRKYTNRTVWTIGPLLPESILGLKSSSPTVTGEKRAGKEPGVSPEKCIEWLDSHSANSVVYISFGSQNTISPSQMMEMARGLEMSGKPFIWAVRPPLGFDMNTEFKPEWLPLNFEQRIKNSKLGLVVHKWAPQLEILSHKSTGVFLSHCGWNSVLESLSQGVPIIGWPLGAEQAYNSKMLVEEMGVGVELTRGINGVLTAEEVTRVVALVMEDGEIRRKAGDIRGKIREAVREAGENDVGSSVQAMDDFVAYLRRGD